MVKIRSYLGVNISFIAWACFFVFLVSNTLLSYFALPLVTRLQIGLWGIFFPFLFAFFSDPKKLRETPSCLEHEFLPSIPNWLWILVFFSGIFLRLHQLVSLSTWPTPDEGNYALGSMDLSQNGIWHLSYTIRQHPPLFNWALALFFKWISPSIFSLWLFPAILSILALLIAGLAGRAYLSKSSNFICFVLAATGFWPLFVGRFCSNFILSFLFEFLAFLILSLFLRSQSAGQYRRYALLLGLCVGFGLFTFVVWTVVAVAVILAFVFSRGKKGKWTFLNFFLPLSCFGVFSVYFYCAHAKPIQSEWGFRSGMDFSQQFVSSFSYLSAMFWGTSKYCYGPVWGGLFNPVFDSLTFLGMAVCCRKWNTAFYKWILICLGLFILPGVVSRDLETFRVIFTFPLLAMVAVMGMGLLLGPLKKYRKITIGILLIAGSCLDIYHLYGPYHSRFGTPGPEWYYMKTNTGYQAYLKLEDIHRIRGKGFILHDLRVVNDPTLQAATFGFDAAQNTGIPFQDAKWAAVIVGMDYLPFLSRRVPEITWYPLGKEQKQDPMEWWLGIIPCESERTRKMLKEWVRAGLEIRSVSGQLMNSSPGNLSLPVMTCFPEAQSLVRNDPFLASCFWEKMIFYYCIVEKNDEKAFSAIDQCAKYGYPLPHLLDLKKALMKSRRQMTPQNQPVEIIENRGGKV